MFHILRKIAVLRLLVAGVAIAAWNAPVTALDEIWDLEAVDANGNGIHPALGTMDTVTFQGIVLNDPEAMLNTADQWQMYVQAFPDNPTPYNHGGIALYANRWYGGTWPRYSTDFTPGDVVEVTGLLGFYNGKTNLNERHSPINAFTVNRLGPGELPEPQLIPSIAECNYFDPSDADSDGLPDRASGGERWQGQWSELRGVSLVDPAAGWGNGQTVSVTDASGSTLNMLCGYLGNFDTAAPPVGRFNLTAIFDQEDDNSDGDYHDLYRVWPLTYNTTHFLLWGDTDTDGDVDLQDAGDLLLNFTGAGGTGMGWADGDFNDDADVDLQDASDLLLNFTGAGGGPPRPPCGPADPETALGTYDPATGEIVLSASGIEFVMIEGEGLLTGDDPDWSFLAGNPLDDDCDDFLGFWAMNNPQTFTNETIGNVAAPGLGEGDLTLAYQAGFYTERVTVPLTVIPEPATLALLAIGLTLTAVRRRTRA